MFGDPQSLKLAAVGLVAGVISGLFGVGGGLVIVPALVLLLEFTQHRATGTSLAVLLPPIGLLAVLEYHRKGNVDIAAACLIAAFLFVGAYFGARLANQMSQTQLRLCFGIFLLFVSLYYIHGSASKLGWLGGEPAVETAPAPGDESAPDRKDE